MAPHKTCSNGNEFTGNKGVLSFKQLRSLLPLWPVTWPYSNMTFNMIFKMPYFNSSTSVFLLKLLILSGTLEKKSPLCQIPKFSLLCQVSNKSPITVVRKDFPNYFNSSLSRLSEIKLTFVFKKRISSWIVVQKHIFYVGNNNITDKHLWILKLPHVCI